MKGKHPVVVLMHFYLWPIFMVLYLFTCYSLISLQAAKLPMSIIIVGVGQAEFDGTVTLCFAFLTDALL